MGLAKPLVTGALVLAVCLGWQRLPSRGIAISFSPAAAATQPEAAGGLPNPIAAGHEVIIHLPDRWIPAVRYKVGTKSASQASPLATHHRIEAPTVGLSVAVVDYSDCTGATLLTRVAAASFACTDPDHPLVMGHNPGVFTPLTRVRTGDEIRYWDARGLRTYRVSTIERVRYGDVWQRVLIRGSHLVLMTCAVPDGSRDWVFVAYPA